MFIALVVVVVAVSVRVMGVFDVKKEHKPRNLTMRGVFFLSKINSNVKGNLKYSLNVIIQMKLKLIYILYINQLYIIYKFVCV